jgi:hypothetical protein
VARIGFAWFPTTPATHRTAPKGAEIAAATKEAANSRPLENPLLSETVEMIAEAVIGRTPGIETARDFAYFIALVRGFILIKPVPTA